jgi:selenocysteine-specific elongation factor
VRVHLEKAAVLTRGDRYILRSYSPPTTIAGGTILDPQPPRGRLRTAAGFERLQRLDADAHAERGALEAVSAMIEERGAGGLSRRQLVSRAGIAPEELDATIARLVKDERAVNLGDDIVDRRVMDRLAQQLMADVQRYHLSHPLAEGLPREEVRERLFKQASPAVFDRVLTGLATSGRLVARDHLAAAEHRVSLSPEEQAAQDAIEQAFRAAGFKPPELADVAAAAGIPGAVVERVVRLLLRQKLLVRLDTLVFHQETLTRLKADVAALKVSDRAPVRIDVGTFKERYGISRKFAIPLLEYLDRERITRRMGDVRIVL